MSDATLDIERALLGSFIEQPDRLLDVEGVLGEEMFTGPRRLVWRAIDGLYRAGGELDAVTVRAELERLAPGVSGSAVVVAGLLEHSAPGHVPHHARTLRATRTREALVSFGQRVASEARSVRADAQDVQRFSDEVLGELFALTDTGTSLMRKPSLAEQIQEVLDASRAAASLEVRGVRTGIHKLDEIVGGLRPGLIVIAARPSMGKSALATTIMMRAAQSSAHEFGRPCRTLLCSLEMSNAQIITRLLSASAGVDGRRIFSGRMDLEERERVASAAQDMRSWGITLEDSPTMALYKLRGVCRRVARDQGIDLVIVDYLQLLRSGEKAESRQVEIAHISQGLKALSRELRVPVIALSQLSRAVEQRDDKTPRLSDLRESGAIEQDADIVMLLYRPAYYDVNASDEEQKHAQLVVAKNREGSTGKVDMFFRRELTRFDNVEAFASEAIG